MFDLDEEEVARIHAAYVGDEELELTRARLSGPFDCALFGDFCEQVGRDAAIEITEMQVELARQGATLGEMNAQTAAWIAEAMDQYEPEEDELTFRDSGPWATRTKGDYRLQVRNGITVPWAGDREAWTQSKFQHQDWLGAWWQVQADSLCVNAGLNTTVFLNSGIPQTIESYDPVNTCWSNDGNVEVITYHTRFSSAGGLYTITADGCGSADHDGTHFGICAQAQVESF